MCCSWHGSFHIDLFTASDHCSPFFYLLHIPRLHSLPWEWGLGSKAVMVASRSPRIPGRGAVCALDGGAGLSLQAAGWAVPCQEWSAGLGKHPAWRTGLPPRVCSRTPDGPRCSEPFVMAFPGSLLSQLYLLNINKPMSPGNHHHSLANPCGISQGEVRSANLRIVEKN